MFKLRCTLVRTAKRFYSTNVRNLGIIAHIDAGKTTTTERMLYLSGLTNRIGDVDQGDTVMDYLPAERDRGITITSAAITFNWANHRMNLIDTPGHADFTFEVIRSIRVLDGAVTVLDAVAGVEAQTEKVWKQAEEMKIPKIVFVNKMDRAGAGFGRTVKEVVSKLNTKVAIVNIPYFDESTSDAQFTGVIDVIDKKLIKWAPDSDGKQVDVSDCQIDELVKARTALVESLCELDEELVEEYLELEDYMAVSAASIRRALRQATLKRQIVPVLCGASFRNIGVQPLLQAIVDYLPAPNERPAPHAVVVRAAHSQKSKKNKHTAARVSQSEDVVVDPESKQMACALAFKVVNDPIRGILVFVRVYAGKLQFGSTVLNTSNGKKERISRLLQMQADESIEVDAIEHGSIGVIVGSKDIKTGDTIVAHGTRKDGAHLLNDRDQSLHLNPIAIPPPVFFATIEPMTLSDKRGMEAALDILLREDPSLHLTYDQDSDQTLISGMGELHLEIARDRLVNDLKARVEMGSIQVSYKESILVPSQSIDETVTPDDGDAKSACSVKLRVEPLPEEDHAGELLDRDDNYLIYPDIEPHPVLSHEEITHAVRVGAFPALARGGKIAHLPLHSIRVIVESVELPPDAVSASALSTAVRLAAEKALESLKKSDYAVMEPLMDVRIILNEEDIGSVVNDISGTRRGHIVSLGQDEASEQFVGGWKDEAEKTYIPPDPTLYLSKHDARVNSTQSVVHARVSLSKMIGYLPTLRSMTQGRGTYQMDFYQYEVVSPDRVADVLNSL